VIGISNRVVVPLNNLPPEITCPDPIVTYTSETSCDTTLNDGLASIYSDPNDNIVSLTWVMTGATTAASPSTGINNLSSYTFSLGTTTIAYTVTDALGLSATCSFTVTVVDNVDPVAICQDITLTLDLITGIATLTPSDIDNGSYDNCGIDSLWISREVFDCTDLGENTVTLTVTDFAGNEDSCTATITVVYEEDPLPMATPDTMVICNAGTTDIALSNNIPNTTWTWTVTSPPAVSGTSPHNSGAYTSINQVLFNADRGVQTVTYEITGTIYELCVIDPVSAVVLINPTPEIMAAPADTTVCDGGTAEIFISNMNTSAIGQWVYDLRVIPDPGITGNTSGDSNLTAVNLVQTLSNTDSVNRKVEYYFTPRIVLEDGTTGCEGIERIVTVWVKPSMNYAYTEELSDYNGFNISCYGMADGYINITPKEYFGPLSYSWTGPLGFVSAEEDITGLRSGLYTLTVTDNLMCADTGEFVLIEPDELGMALTLSTSRDGSYNINCVGDSTGTILVEPFNYVDSVSYFWKDGATEAYRYNLVAGRYNVIIVDKNNCSARDLAILTEPDPITMEFSKNHPYCPESPDGEITVTANGGVADYTYLWTNGETTSTIVELTMGYYPVTVTDMNGCTAIDSTELQAINAHCLTIPNAISPNDDAINDVWNLGFTQIYPDMTVIIFNSWGQTVWESAPGYPEPWDGTSNGKPLPMDSYFYIIDLKDQVTAPITGHVTIIK
jgi:gliding motility-associated-like protein